MEEHSPHYLKLYLISGKLWTKISDTVNLRQRYTIYTETTYAKMIGLLQPQGLGDIPRRKYHKTY